MVGDTHRRDDGSVLLLTLIVVVGVGLTAMALARYAGTSLRAGNLAESAILRQSAADGALKASIDVIAAGLAPCLYSTRTHDLPVYGLDVPANRSATSVRCRALDGPVDAMQLWSLVVTGEGVPTAPPPAHGLIENDAPIQTDDGPVWISRIDADALQDIGAAVSVDGPLVTFMTTCPAPGAEPTPASVSPEFAFDTPLRDRPVCVPTDWQHQPSFDDPPLPPSFDTLPAQPALPYSELDGCRIYIPGDYRALGDLTVDVDSYFRTGDYLFGGTVRISGPGVEVVAGRADTEFDLTPDVPAAWPCQAAHDSDFLGGASFYLAGSADDLTESAALRVVDGAQIEIMPRLQRGTDTTSDAPAHEREMYVSVQAICDPASGPWCDSDGGFPPNTRDGDTPIVETAFAEDSVSRFHGLVYVPLAQVQLDSQFARVDFNGGLVTSRLFSARATTNVRAPSDHPSTSIDLLLTATATNSSGTTRMQANVTYDPTPTDPDDRVLVTAWNLCDPTGC